MFTVRWKERSQWENLEISRFDIGFFLLLDYRYLFFFTLEPFSLTHILTTNLHICTHITDICSIHIIIEHGNINTVKDNNLPLKRLPIIKKKNDRNRSDKFLWKHSLLVSCIKYRASLLFVPFGREVHICTNIYINMCMYIITYVHPFLP